MKLKLSVSGDRAARLFYAKDLKRPPLPLCLQYFSATETSLIGGSQGITGEVCPIYGLMHFISIL